MARPFVIPANWKHADWDDLCELCGQPHFMVMLAEARLPAGGLEVIRCETCGRALWYRSNATPNNVADYAETVAVWATAQRHLHPRKREPESKGMRTRTS